ncbi:PDR/VanB family oxidoreductase [Paraburkholderia elongata]|jgi:phthalate 4,5-dioxygenase reductase subunit|uniref:2Fe-2S iron-sulfur cluster binding domain-containing protein n=1 Tax=Paraburkholderia elongata TaxID=2675747 RepID=A0A972P069_9BURK|nr:PDR/VanB family oxidoreductase [Paraburkholderia elongata]NPT62431.1 2Fe-2S iron-sulfur cluster binding domain-containing protein [Paraburkholderia elongata]
MSPVQDDFFSSLKIAGKQQVARDIWRFELCDPSGAELPEFRAGSNLTVQVPNGSRRRYSLCNSPEERNRYVIAVKRDANGRGGSISMIDDTREGALINVSVPKNDFPLDGRAQEFILIAGGIGITPMLSMMHELRTEGLRKFRLIYVARDPEATAFLEELQGDEWRSHVKVHHDYGDVSKSFDFWSVFERPTKAHVYCCGPRALMDAVKDMTGHWPTGSVHFESFGVDGSVLRENKSFTVRLAKSGDTFEIPADRSILESLRDAGIRVPSSCESGTCGSCRTQLCSGTADHRDMVLEEEEKSGQIMVCVSRALSEELVLDL